MGNIDLLEDACAKLPHTTRAMFGGHGLFAPNGGMFAGIVDDDRIILKLAQDPERADLIALGGAPWVYNGKMTMKDWIVIPDAFYDEPSTLAAWARKAHAIAPGKAAKRSAKKVDAVKGAGVPKMPRAPVAKAAPAPARKAKVAKKAKTTKKARTAKKAKTTKKARTAKTVAKKPKAKRAGAKRAR